ARPRFQGPRSRKNCAGSLAGRTTVWRPFTSCGELVTRDHEAEGSKLVTLHNCHADAQSGQERVTVPPTTATARAGMAIAYFCRRTFSSAARSESVKDELKILTSAISPVRKDVRVCWAPSTNRGGEPSDCEPPVAVPDKSPSMYNARAPVARVRLNVT